MKDILNTLFGVIKQRFIGFLTELRKLKNPSFWKTVFVAKLSAFFSKILNFRARNKKDYYTVFGWLIAKRVAFAIMIVVGVASMYYLLVVNPIFNLGNGGVKTYSYKSIPLRFTSGEVNIKAKDGHIAYSGDVAKGKVTGYGTLYAADEHVIYDGSFDSNQYDGDGKLYYSNAVLEYEGSFADNLYSGEGTLYRTNGTTEYHGSFSQGMKNGNGILYDKASKQVYSGSFINDDIVYSEMLGLATKDVSQFYSGDAVIYSDDAYYTVYMSDINALYFGLNESDTLAGDIMVDAIYVLADKYPSGDGYCNNISEINKVLGAPSYDGNITIIMPEAVALDYLSKNEGSECADPGLVTTKTFDDLITVDSFDTDYSMYIYSYDVDGLTISFYCNDSDGYFVMYQIAKNS